MNRGVQQMQHCVQSLCVSGEDMTVLERKTARLKWQQQSQQAFFGDLLPLTQTLQHLSPIFPSETSATINEFSPLPELGPKEALCFENGWPDFSKYSLYSRAGLEDESKASLIVVPCEGSNISGTSSCPPLGCNVSAEERERQSVLPSPEKISSPKESSKKRKAAEKSENTRLVSTPTEDCKEKRIKGGNPHEAESNGSELSNSNKKQTSTNDTWRDSNSKITEVQKLDYIHVRARRGQATDSHSLAERVRREKISERMKCLQDLVPGCNKITGKAGMLDEIINYVQSLQKQVEFLSMKLATVNPRLDFNLESFFPTEVFTDCSNTFPTLGLSHELADQAFLQFNSVEQGVSCCGSEMAINPQETMHLRRTISAPVSVPDTFMDSSCSHVHGSSFAWDIDLQTLYNTGMHQGRQSAFPSQPFLGNLEANNLKMEM